MDRLRSQKSSGISGNTLRTWGLIFLTLGTIGGGLLEKKLLGLGTISGEQLLASLQENPANMTLASLALLLKAVSTCAVPIFGLMLVEGVDNTSSWIEYFKRMLILAVVTEIPYDLATSSAFLEMRYQNPVFGMAVAMVMLYFYDRYEENSFKNVVLKVMVTLVALAWGWMLRIDDGTCLILTVMVLWVFRKKPLYRNFAGAAIVILCAIISPFYLAAPMGFLVIHFYNGEREEPSSRILYYGTYPVILLVAGLITKFLF